MAKATPRTGITMDDAIVSSFDTTSNTIAVAPTSAAVTNAGTFAVQDSQVIADDAAFTVASSKLFAVGFLADETSTDSVDEGDLGAARITLDRRLHVTQAGYSNNYISTATTTTVKSGAGQLHLIMVTGGTAGTIIVYDNTAASGTILGSFDSTNSIAVYPFNCSFATGLTIITSQATKISVIYK